MTHLVPTTSRQGAQGRIQLGSLELFAAERCNLRCEQCAASSPYLTEEEHPVAADVSTVLGHLAKVLHARQIKVLGGEPLLNPQLLLLLKRIRAAEIADRIRLTTNGILLGRASEETWALLDEVEVSWYPRAPRAPSRREIARLSQQAKRRGVRFVATPVTVFRVAIVDECISDAAVVQNIYDACEEAHGTPCHQVYRNRYFRCSRAPMLDKYLDTIGVEHEPFLERDGLLIDGRSSFWEELREYIASPKPLEACSFCLGTSGVLLRHRQLSAEEIRKKRSGVGRVSYHHDMLTFHRPWPIRAAQWLRRLQDLIVWSPEPTKLPGRAWAMFCQRLRATRAARIGPGRKRQTAPSSRGGGSGIGGQPG